MAHVDWELEMAKLKASLPRVREMMAWITTHYPEYAQQYKRYFDALVAEGFTPEQAIEIIKVHGWVPK